MAYSKEQRKWIFMGFTTLMVLVAWMGSGSTEIEASTNLSNTQKSHEKVDKDVDVGKLSILGNHTGFTINGKAAQSISFGIKGDLECSATWQMDELNPQAAKALVKKDKNNSDKTTSIECYFGNNNFVQSSKHDTIFELFLVDNKPEDKTAKFVVKFHLLNITNTSPEYLTMNYTEMDITPDNYELIF